MSAWVAGDARAFERLFARLAPRVHGFFLRSFRDPGVADDLLQVTFMKVHRARSQYRKDLSLAPWLFAIAARVRL
ncbi:MAG: RNA polymerase sigma factor, partial [Deltaproteobacteria bacterium]